MKNSLKKKRREESKKEKGKRERRKERKKEKDGFFLSFLNILFVPKKLVCFITQVQFTDSL